MSTPCDLPTCNLPAFRVHGIGCGAVACPEHSGGDLCPVCESPWELAEAS